MSNISTRINLKKIEIEEVRPEVEKLMIDAEKMICAFKPIRDQVIPTNSRIFVVNVKRITRKNA